MAKKVYAVRVGKSRGIFDTWDECKAMVHGFKGAEYKSFPTREEAENYLNQKKEQVPIERYSNCLCRRQLFERIQKICLRLCYFVSK